MKILRMAAMVLAFALVLPLGAGAEEIACFGSETDQLRGIFLTRVPEQGLYLGGRALKAGDVLTAEQAALVTFAPGEEMTQVGYLPIREQVEEVQVLSLRGKENKAPAAVDSALETYKNLPNSAPLKVSDPEGDAMTYTLVRKPRRGTVTIEENGRFTYTPGKNKVGVDSFTYTASDAAGNVSREATVTVTVLKTKSPAYTDTLGKPCRFSAEWMKNTGIFLGEQVGEQRCFSPEKTVTRGEFTAMLVNALEIPVDPGLTYTGFDDAIPQWLQPYVAAAVRSGLTSALTQPEVFAPGEPISAAEAAAMTALGTDAEILEAWSQETAPITRAQAAMLLYEACG